MPDSQRTEEQGKSAEALKQRRESKGDRRQGNLWVTEVPSKDGDQTVQPQAVLGTSASDPGGWVDSRRDRACPAGGGVPSGL